MSDPATKPDDWVLAKWEREGWPMVIRMASAYRGLGSVPGYGHRVIVTVPFRDPKPSGHPSDAEWDDLKSFELNVCRLLEAENRSLCVLVITGQRVRDIIFYTKDPEQVKPTIDGAQLALSSHRFELQIEAEPEWRVYRFFCEKLSPSHPPEART
jgi:hypothetical protein